MLQMRGMQVHRMPLLQVQGLQLRGQVTNNRKGAAGLLSCERERFLELAGYAEADWSPAWEWT